MFNFSFHSLQDPSAQRILSAAMEAADPSDAIRAAITLQADWIASAHGVYLLSVGKAGMRMAEAALPFVNDKLAGGLVITKHASHLTFGRAAVIEAGHPLPDARSLEAGQRVLGLLSRLTPHDLLICLISGGASALMAAPRPGISLNDLRSVTSILLAGGASIDELNLIRKQLDDLKGGGLARRSAAPILSLILSDVMGDRLDLIASGLTVPNLATRVEIERIMSKYGMTSRISSAMLQALAHEPDVATFAHVHNMIVGSNAQVVAAARKQAAREGYRTRVQANSLQGEARQAGKELARKLRRARTRPLCILAGGETTVTVTGEGRGGRCQELALAAALELDGMKDVMLISFATDGDDGTTGAAGAVVTGETLARARSLGLDARDFLRRNDSYTFFASLDDLIVTGPTGTNVNDLVLLFKH
jgi:glycerate 2-kinase